MFTINNHNVSNFYAGLVVYVVDGKNYCDISQAAKVCGISNERFKELCWENR